MKYMASLTATIRFLEMRYEGVDQRSNKQATTSTQDARAARNQGKQEGKQAGKQGWNEATRVMVECGVSEYPEPNCPAHVQGGFHVFPPSHRANRSPQARRIARQRTPSFSQQDIARRRGVSAAPAPLTKTTHCY